MTWPRLIVFDLDGTLIDSAPDIHAAVNLMLGEYGREPLPLAEVTRMIGDGTHKLVERALTARPGPAIEAEAAHERFVAHYAAAPYTLTRTYPGVAATIPRLAADGIRLALLTNKPAELSREILRHLGLAESFERILGGDSTPWRKPDPRGLAQICHESGIAAADALMVGDSEIDAATAEAAAMTFVLMSYGYHRGPLAEIPHQALLDTMADLNAALFHEIAARA